MRRTAAGALALAAFTSVSVVQGQQQRPMSPPGTAATQVGGKWVPGQGGGQSYQGGKWIEIIYNRPILRGRQIFGSGADYGKTVYDGAPVWRAGANQSTRLRSEVPLEIGGKRVPAGEYSLFIDLKNEKDWTLIVSSHAFQEKYDPQNKTALWGAYGYTPDKDVARAPMKVETLSMNVDQLTWGFTDVTDTGGTMRIWWGRNMASVPFRIVTS